MENKPPILRPTTDNLYEHMIQRAQDLPEGILTGEIVRKYFGFSNDAQLKVFLKTQKHLHFEVSPTEGVEPLFTKWEVLNHLEEKDRELKERFISPEASEEELL